MCKSPLWLLRLCKAMLVIGIVGMSLMSLQAQKLPNVGGEVYCTLLSNDGQTLFVGGKFKGADGSLNWSILAIDVAKGIAKSSWKNTKILNDNNDPGTIYALAEGVYNGNSVLFIGGQFTAVSGGVFEKRANLAMLNTEDGSLVLDWQADVLGKDLTPSTGSVFALAVLPVVIDKSSKYLFVGGKFKNLKSTPQSSFAVVDIASIKPLENVPAFYNSNDLSELGIIKSITINSAALISTSSFEVLIGGQFQPITEFKANLTSGNTPQISTTFKNYNFAWYSYFASKTGSFWELPPDWQTSFTMANTNDPLAFVEAIVVRKNPLTREDEAFIGGTFLKAYNYHTGASNTGLNYSLACITKKGPVDWYPWVYTGNFKDFGNVNALALTKNNSQLCLGGRFDAINGQARTNTAQFDVSSPLPPTLPPSNLTNWSVTPFNGSPITRVNALAVLNDADIAIGGNFTQVNNLDRLNLVRSTLFGIGAPYSIPHGNELLIHTVKSVESNAMLLDHFQVFPNPSKGEIHLSFPVSFVGNVRVRIISALGMTVMESTEQITVGQTIFLNLLNLSPGAYLVEAFTNEKKYQRSIIIH